MTKDNLKFNGVLYTCVKRSPYIFSPFIGLVVVVLVMATATANAAITDFNISNPYVWDDQFSMWGTVTNPNADRNILCDFYVFAHDGHLIKRFTSEYAGTGGQFSSNPQTLTSPPFYREQDYNAVVYCAGATANLDFNVIQRRTLETNINQEYKWALDSSNIISVLIVVAVTILAIGIYGFVRKK